MDFDELDKDICAGKEPLTEESRLMVVYKLRDINVLGSWRGIKVFKHLSAYRSKPSVDGSG